MATGGLRYWTDGRNVPDVLLALFDYPRALISAFALNFVDGGEESEGFLFTGSEGTMEIAGQTVTVTRAPLEKEPGYTISTFSNAMQKEFLSQYRPSTHQHYPPAPHTPPLRNSPPHAATSNT